VRLLAQDATIHHCLSRPKAAANFFAANQATIEAAIVGSAGSAVGGSRRQTSGGKGQKEESKERRDEKGEVSVICTF